MASPNVTAAQELLTLNIQRASHYREEIRCLCRSWHDDGARETLLRTCPELSMIALGWSLAVADAFNLLRETQEVEEQAVRPG